MTAPQFVKWNSLFLGGSMLLFGLLKFVDPFRGWYETQVTASGLPPGSYAMGILGEIVTGLVLILPFFIKRLRPYRGLLPLAGSLAIFVMMIVAIYVHQHPDVPAEVLPLKIKPPLIPGVFFILAQANVWAAWQARADLAKA